MQFPITLGLHRSLLLDRIVLGLVLGGSLLILFYPRAIALQLLMLVLLWCGVGHVWWRLRPAMSALRLERDGSLALLRPGATGFQPVSCLPGAAVHPGLTVLRLRSDTGKTESLVLTVDSMDCEDFRRLRVFLRWRAEFSGAGDAV